MGERRCNQALELLSLLRFSWALKYILISSGSGYSTLTSASKQFKIYRVFCAHTFLRVIFQITRLSCIFLTANYKHIQELLVQLIWTQAYIGVLFFYLHILYYRNEICMFLNMWIKFEESLNSGLTRIPYARKKLDLRFARALLILLNITVVTAAFTKVLLRGSSCTFEYDWEQTYTIWIFIYLYLYELSAVLLPASTLFAYGIIIIGYVYFSSRLMTQLTRSPKGNRSEQNSIYRALYLLHEEFNRQFGGSAIVVFTLNGFAIGMLSNIIVIRFHHDIHFLFLLVFTSGSFIATIGVILTFPMASSICMTSLKFRNFWRSNRLSRYHVSCSLACRPMRVQIGPFHSCRRSTTITALGKNIHTTLRIVVAL